MVRKMIEMFRKLINNIKTKIIKRLNIIRAKWTDHYEALMALFCALCGEVFAYMAVLLLDHNRLGWITFNRWPNNIEKFALVVALPVSGVFALAGYAITTRYQTWKAFHKNHAILKSVHDVLEKVNEASATNQLLPYKGIVSRVFLNELNLKMNKLSADGLPVDTADFALIIETLLDHVLEHIRNNGPSKKLEIYSTCVLTPVEFMNDELTEYRDHWITFVEGAKFIGYEFKFIRLLMPNLRSDLDDLERDKEYRVWDTALKDALVSKSEVKTFIEWNYANEFELYKLTKPYYEAFMGIQFNGSPLNDFIILSEIDKDNKVECGVVIGGTKEGRVFLVKYEANLLILNRYRKYYNYLLKDSEKVDLSNYQTRL